VVVDQVGLNIDIAPTLAAIAKASPTIAVDGRSLLPLILGGGSASWRQSFEAERGPQDTASIFLKAQGSSAQVELGDAAERFPGVGWNAVRTEHWKYVEWENGERELYDLVADPYELMNLFSGGDTTAAPALAARLHQLMTCAGSACQMLEDQPVP
jgi:arylsulfatase A-like enzyme